MLHRESSETPSLAATLTGSLNRAELQACARVVAQSEVATTPAELQAWLAQQPDLLAMRDGVCKMIAALDAVPAKVA
jgi:hypothetical protein